MASRLSLGRIIGWGKEADPEELHFVLHRLTHIAQERAARVAGADGLGKVRRVRRTKKQIAADQQNAKPPAESQQAVVAS